MLRDHVSTSSETEGDQTDEPFGVILIGGCSCAFQDDCVKILDFSHQAVLTVATEIQASSEHLSQ